MQMYTYTSVNCVDPVACGKPWELPLVVCLWVGQADVCVAAKSAFGTGYPRHSARDG